MARSRKGSRNIVVRDVTYRWKATGNDATIDVAIWPSEFDHAGVYGWFSYGENTSSNPSSVDEPSPANRGQIVVTARIVRRVIEHALDELGFDPKSNGGELNLQCLDDRINLSDVDRAS